MGGRQKPKYASGSPLSEKTGSMHLLVAKYKDDLLIHLATFAKNHFDLNVFSASLKTRNIELVTLFNANGD